jgi:broad specificity phosphatase PhoE
MPLMGLANKYKGKTLLIVAHSNTIPAAINELLGKQTYLDIPENEFGNLYIIKITGSKITHDLIKT